MPYKHKNGAERNLLKLKHEAEHLNLHMRPYWRDWLNAPWNVHHFIDLFVESCRMRPYFMGHVWGIYLPVSLGVIVWLAL